MRTRVMRPPKSASRRSPRPTTSCPTPSGARSTTRPARSSAAAASACRARAVVPAVTPSTSATEPAAGTAGTAAEQVAEVEGVTAGAAAAEERAGLVVLLAPLGVGQDVVGLGDLLEALFGGRVTLVRIRVVLAG